MTRRTYTRDPEYQRRLAHKNRMIVLAENLAQPLGLEYRLPSKGGLTLHMAVNQMPTLGYEVIKSFLTVDICLPSIGEFQNGVFDVVLCALPGCYYDWIGDFGKIAGLFGKAVDIRIALSASGGRLICDMSSGRTLGNALFSADYLFRFCSEMEERPEDPEVIAALDLKLGSEIRNSARAIYRVEGRLTPEDALAKMTSPEREI
ncbi:MAG: hypothetical protein V1659_01740 [Candidatus Woesearchaeota archaeon]